MAITTDYLIKKGFVDESGEDVGYVRGFPTGSGWDFFIEKVIPSKPSKTGNYVHTGVCKNGVACYFKDCETPEELEAMFLSVSGITLEG